MGRITWGRSSVGRALAWHARGHGFNSRRLQSRALTPSRTRGTSGPRSRLGGRVRWARRSAPTRRARSALQDGGRESATPGGRSHPRSRRIQNGVCHPLPVAGPLQVVRPSPAGGPLLSGPSPRTGWRTPRRRRGEVPSLGRSRSFLPRGTCAGGARRGAPAEPVPAGDGSDRVRGEGESLLPS